MTAQWVYPSYDSSKIRTLTQENKVSALTAQLLINRGVDTPELAEKYINPKMTDLHDPLDLPDMQKAVDRLDAAIANKDLILIYADYDCDGLGGSSILYNVLRELGANVSIFIPDRNKDGYGIRVERLERAARDGVKVVITVDSGVTAFDAAEFCLSQKMDLIVTDHHEMKDNRVPRAFAVVHPRVPGSRYKNPNPCGTAVAFKLAWAIARHKSGKNKPDPALRSILLESMGVVALGSIADVVDLVGENRVLVRHGLKNLESTPVPGFEALIDVGNVEFPIDCTQVGFKIAPRINAASRMGDATRAFNLLTTKDPIEARLLALELDQDNNRRKASQKEITARALAEVERVYGSNRATLPPGLVIALPNCSVGIVGIIASKLVDEFRRPSLVLGIENGKIKGSGRTIHGASLLRCLNKCKEHLVTYGGHAMACGLQLLPGHLDAFRQDWSLAVAEEAGNADIGGKNLYLDAIIDLESVTPELLREISVLQPCGAGNRPALLGATGLTLESLKSMGDPDAGHFSFMVRGPESRGFRAVAFGKPALYEKLVQAIKSRGATKIDIAFEPRQNQFMGRKSIQLECEDVRVY